MQNLEHRKFQIDLERQLAQIQREKEKKEQLEYSKDVGSPVTVSGL